MIRDLTIQKLLEQLSYKFPNAPIPFVLEQTMLQEKSFIYQFALGFNELGNCNQIKAI